MGQKRTPLGATPNFRHCICPMSNARESKYITHNLQEHNIICFETGVKVIFENISRKHIACLFC